MKRKVYKATNVKKINMNTLKQEVEGKDRIPGIDVAKEDCIATIMDRKIIKAFKWKHPFESHFSLI